MLPIITKQGPKASLQVYYRILTTVVLRLSLIEPPFWRGLHRCVLVTGKA